MPFSFVRKMEVPVYLRSGVFYLSLSDEDDEQISVPSNVLKMDTTIENNADLEHLLTSLRFWGVSDVCEEVIRFSLCMDNVGTCMSVLERFQQDFPYIEVLTRIIPGMRDDRRARIAIESGILPIVRSLGENGYTLNRGCLYAAQHGHPHILIHLHQQGGELTDHVFIVAIHSGNLPCVAYIRSQRLSWPEDTLMRCLLLGHTSCLQYALDDGCLWGSKDKGILTKTDTHATRLQYAIQHGYPMRVEDATGAAEHGALLCLQILHEAHCPWDETTTLAAMTNGHHDCAIYAVTHGCPAVPQCCCHAAGVGDLTLLQFLYEVAAPWDESTCTAAAQRGFLECLQYAHEHGCPWNMETPDAAARYGHLECLQYAYHHGCEWDEYTCRAAAEGGHIDCLTFAYERGCPMDTLAAYAAAEYGHLDCLQYAHEQGCDVDKWVYEVALQGYHLDGTAYIETHCPWVLR